MTPITFNDLIALLIECAGDETGPVSVSDLDTPFEDLGYDSLALLETTGQIERDHGLVLPDGLLADLRTPRQLLEALNAQLTAA